MSYQKIKVLPDLKVIYENLQLPFPLAEYKVRLTKIRREMAEREIDLLYLSSPESMFYVSGLNMAWYRTGSSTMWDEAKATGIAVHVDHDTFMIFEMADELGLLSGATCATDIRIMEDMNASSLHREADLYDFIVNNLKEEGWLTGRVALEKKCCRPPRHVNEIMEARFSQKGCQVVDGTEIVAKLRRKKSPMELNYVRKASAIADIGHKAVADQLSAGMSELEAVGIYTHAMMNAGGESMSIADMVRSGKGKLWCGHAPASRKTIMPGEPVAVDLAGVYNRYHATMGRCYYIGEADPQFADAYYKGNVLVMREVKNLLKPNLLVREFYKELVRIYKELGLWENHNRIGGCELGIAFPPDWCGEFVHGPFGYDQENQFEPGMVISFHTGMGVIDTIMFTEKEAEILTNTTHELMIVE